MIATGGVTKVDDGRGTIGFQSDFEKQVLSGFVTYTTEGIERKRCRNNASGQKTSFNGKLGFGSGDEVL